jgi:hypothetical protein
VVANLDQDPAVETTDGQTIWEWKAGAWVEQPEYKGLLGHVAVANFGAYGVGLPAGLPEIAVTNGAQVAIFAIDGTPALEPLVVPGGAGGPPTVADFDGDGLPELAVASGSAYTVVDIDCGPSPRPGGICPKGACEPGPDPCPPGIAWSRATQDASSAITGSSVFDFEGDGHAEAVYADECFVRVYDGATGEVLFSQYRSSCTWYENPVIADVDGNLRADLVVPSNLACSDGVSGIGCWGLNADGVDAQFDGLRCKTGGGDCASGTCDAGLCRCKSGAECCGAADEAKCLEQGYKCAAPNEGTPGKGDTCRAAHPRGLTGIRVFSDLNDNWVRSRTIWNQHPYAVTHVNEDGTIHRTSQWKNNWEIQNLNNFRQNVPGSPVRAIGDPTVCAARGTACSAGSALLQVPVCNRGSEQLAAGLPVGFYVGGKSICQATTAGILPVGQCESVGCAWASPPRTQAEAVTVEVVANDQTPRAECKKGNDRGSIYGVYCP